MNINLPPSAAKHLENDPFKVYTPSSKLERATDWIYHHPTIIKTIEAVGGVFGGASLLALPIALSKFGFIWGVAAFGGGLIGLTSFVAYKMLDILIPPHHEMHHHVFKPATFGAGRLYYQGDIPILELNNEDPYQAGLAHGFLMGDYLNNLIGRLNFIKKIAYLPQAGDVPKAIQDILPTIPKEYLEEMKGLVDGFNQWAEKKWLKAQKITLDDLILFHLMPDSIHFSPDRYSGCAIAQNGKPTIPAIGCTVVIDKDPKEGFVFGRNMDWPSFGILGSYSFVINRKYHNPELSTAEIAIPGFVGTLTGMNSAGLCVAMNVCAGHTDVIKGMPAAFFNRLCLEKCRTTADVMAKIKQQPPLGRYHLSIADTKSALSVHLYQGGESQPHVIREWRKGSPLITTNCVYTAQGRQILHMHDSQERDSIIQRLFNQALSLILIIPLDRVKLIRKALSLHHVNNTLTTHTVMMYPQLKKIAMAFDNSFSGNSQLHELNVSRILY